VVEKKIARENMLDTERKKLFEVEQLIAKNEGFLKGAGSGRLLKPCKSFSW